MEDRNTEKSLIAQNRKNKITIKTYQFYSYVLYTQEEWKICPYKTYTQMFISALFIITKKQKTQMSTKQWVYFYIHI